MPSSKQKRRAMPTETAETEFKTVLRLRPLLKKERDDAIALERFDKSTAVLHPFVSADITTAADSVVHTGQDSEFPLDRVLSAADSQDKLYQAVGQPLALAAMDSLKHHSNHGEANSSNKKSTSHLIIATGLPASGKTFAVAGPAVSKRKTNTDGLVPRMLDSLFAQSKHHHCNSKDNSKKVGFAVKISVLQVNQSKSNPSDCQLYDLLQPVPKLPHRRSPSSSSHESSGLGSAVGSLASTLLQISSTSTSSSGATPKSSSSYAALEEPVKVQQDPVTAECFLANGSERECTSAEEAREVLHKALEHSRHLNHKKYQSHCLITLQPRLVSRRSGRTRQTGESITVLELAVNDSKKQRAAHLRDSLPNRADAYTSVMHCLKAIQHNADVLQHKVGPDDEQQDADFAALRKVPFLQHKLCMLLQPLFSPKQISHAKVTLLLTASPSHREHAEKKLMLSEIVSLHKPRPTSAASTGIVVVNNKKKHHHHQQSTKMTGTKVRKAPPVVEEKKGSCHRNGNDVESTGAAVANHQREPPLERAPSMTYSESTADEVEEEASFPPPPVAPGYLGTGLHPSAILSPAASAPVEEEEEEDRSPAAKQFPPNQTSSSSTRQPPPVLTVDFPGVPLAPMSTQSALTESSSRVVSSSSSDNKPPTMPYDECLVPTESDKEADAEASHNSNKFSYMKTINKVVHASKKKGRRVMERMTVTTYSNGGGGAGGEDSTQLQQRLAELEDQNAALAKENATLRQTNRELQKQLKERGEPAAAVAATPGLTKVLHERDYSSSQKKKVSTDTLRTDQDDDASLVSSWCQSDTPQSATTNATNIKNGKHNNSKARASYEKKAEIRTNDDDDEASSASSVYQSGMPLAATTTMHNSYDNPGSPASTASDQLYDNPLLQHMANMNSQSHWSSSAQRKTTAVSRVDSFREPEMNDENDPASDAPSPMFEDPLYQHMAMMNNLG